VAGGVDDVDPMRLKAPVHTGPEAAYCRRGNGNSALLLLRHPVCRRCAIVNFTELMAHAGVKQDPFSGGGFAGINVGRNTNVAIALEGDGLGHDASLVSLTVSGQSGHLGLTSSS